MKKSIPLFLVVLLLISCLTSCSATGSPAVGIKMSVFHPWLKNVEPSQIVKVEEIHEYYGISPEEKMRSFYSDDRDVISEYVDWCSNLKLMPTVPVEGVGGGGSTTMVFSFADGSTKEIFINHGVYRDGELYFKVRGNSFASANKMTGFYRFNASENGYSIYTYGEESKLIKQAQSGAGDIGFIMVDIDTSENLPTHYLEASFGTVYFYSATLCYIEALGDADGYYELYGTTLSELIN